MVLTVSQQSLINFECNFDPNTNRHSTYNFSAVILSLVRKFTSSVDMQGIVPGGESQFCYFFLLSNAIFDSDTNRVST